MSLDLLLELIGSMFLLEVQAPKIFLLEVPGDEFHEVCGRLPMVVIDWVISGDQTFKIWLSRSLRCSAGRGVLAETGRHDVGLMILS
jgi:hypothetical protein